MRIFPRWRGVALTLVLIAATSSRGVFEAYSPFDPGRPVRRHAVRAYSPANARPAANTKLTLTAPDGANSPLTVGRAEDGGLLLALAPIASRPALETSLPGAAELGVTAGQSDLNQDTLPDYILITHSGGNGLAAQITYVTFLLSTPAGHVRRQLASYDATLQDFTDLDSDGRPEFVHEFFVNGEDATSRAPRNYWVFNLLGFRGSDLVSANDADGRFPAWIWYSFRPNHRPDIRLSAGQRQSWWASATSEESDDWYTVRLDVLRKLKEEQSSAGR